MYSRCLICEMLFLLKKKSQLCCSKSCAQKLKNKNLGFGETEIRKCSFCGKEFISKKSSPKKFCTRICVGRWNMHRPEMQQILHSPIRRKKISLAQIKSHQQNPERAINISRRMKQHNPTKIKGVIEKAKVTKQINGTLHIWSGIRGGNGKLTEPQIRLALALGWETEYAISLGKLTKNYPTNYKVDVANPELKIAIEVDGKNHNTKYFIEKDKKKTAKLQSLGWKVLRFTNDEVIDTLDIVLLKIKKELSQ